MTKSEGWQGRKWDELQTVTAGDGPPVRSFEGNPAVMVDDCYVKGSRPQYVPWPSGKSSVTVAGGEVATINGETFDPYDVFRGEAGERVFVVSSMRRRTLRPNRALIRIGGKHFLCTYHKRARSYGVEFWFHEVNYREA